MKHPHWATHLSSLEALDILTALGLHQLHAQSRSLRQWKLNSWALTSMTWQGRARALSVEGITPVLAESTAASSSLARLKKPSLPSPTRWSPGRIMRQGTGTKSRRRRKRVSESLRRCRESAGATWGTAAEGQPHALKCRVDVLPRRGPTS